MPIKLFQDGEILDASDVNTYFMDQALVVFDTADQRDQAFGGFTGTAPNIVLTEPALTEGRICYLKDDDTLYIYTGSTWSAQLANIADGVITSAKIADGAIMNIDVNASAAIAHSKLATTTAGNILLGTTTTGVITGTAVTGDVTITGAGVTTIGATKVTNAMLAGSIAHSKLANVTAGQVLLGTTTTGIVTATTLTGDVTITGAGVTTLGSDLDLNGATEIDEVIETVVINPTALTGTVQIDAKSGSVHYFTANSAANWIWNLRGDGSTTLNSMMDVGQAMTFSLFATIGTTAYKPTSITVDTSGTVAVKWFGGNAYPSGNVSSIDCYTITVVKTATSTFTAFASQSKFA